MTDSMTYNIPVRMVPLFRGRKMIIRSRDPAEIVRNVADEDLKDLSFIKLCSLDGKIDSLTGWGYAIPVELVVTDICRDLPLLYRYAPLLGSHPIRVSIPLVPGFGKVVKLAVSLNFAVKLEGGQPGEQLRDELLAMARFYLHQSTVAEPIEFFHSLFLAFFHRDPVTLWTIQEEDPSLMRYITDRGEETMPGRLAGLGTDHELCSFLHELRAGLAAEEGECVGCEFFMQCRGYFKRPCKEYRCDVVKALMHTLRSAAEELRSDMASLPAAGEGEGR
ncbi:MAG: hypothetical protein EG824_10320 [Deltaproteobacteria bacterium]|nr:hypothetical protein [Deltaproteobacteria bacterium]